MSKNTTPTPQPATHYSFACFSCAHEWEATTPDADCPKCGTTNRFCAENPAPQPATPELSKMPTAIAEHMPWYPRATPVAAAEPWKVACPHCLRKGDFNEKDACGVDHGRA